MKPYESWLAKAEEDLAVGQLCFREQYFSQACFLSQQVVEKSLKAFLLAKNRSYPRQHKVVKIAALCVEIKLDLKPLDKELKMLDEFYIPTRYPDAVPGGLPGGLPDAKDARLALDTARAVLELVRAKIS